MLQLPKLQPDPKKLEEFCSCRPICKNRRRIWNDKVQHTSAELLIERKPLPDCFRRWPMEVRPNAPCPLYRRTKNVTIDELNVIKPKNVVRLCQAPLEEQIDTPYTNYVELAKKIGASVAVKPGCAFCKCCHCCDCLPRNYVLEDSLHEKEKNDMRQFDKRIRSDCKIMRIMYD